MNPREFSRTRWRIVGVISAPLLVLYLSFVLLIAFYPNSMAMQLAPGLTVAILLGSLVIIGTWLTTWAYVRWANRHLGRRIRDLRAGGSAV
jgi:uncharacterized membrane protein (DUF485 family)